jgi:hypothetical protein
MTVDSHDKIKPWLQRQLGVFIAEDLEAERVVAGARPRLLTGFPVQSANESI